MFLHADGTGRVDSGSHLVPVMTSLDGTSVINQLSVPVAGNTLDLLNNVVATIDIRSIAQRSHCTVCVDFGKEGWYSLVVATAPDDRIVWAKRPRRRRLSRMVLDRTPEPSTKCTIVLEQQADGYYNLISAYIGPPMEIEPDDYIQLLGHGLNKTTRQRIYARSREYWKTHAFVHGWTQHWPETLTDRRPAGWDDAPHLPNFKGRKNEERNPNADLPVV